MSAKRFKESLLLHPNHHNHHHHITKAPYFMASLVHRVCLENKTPATSSYLHFITPVKVYTCGTRNTLRAFLQVFCGYTSLSCAFCRTAVSATGILHSLHETPCYVYRTNQALRILKLYKIRAADGLNDIMQRAECGWGGGGG